MTRPERGDAANGKSDAGTDASPGAGARSGADADAGTLLLGTISLDHYVGDAAPSPDLGLPTPGDVLPGGGVLNMAWHWRRVGRPFRLLTRVGVDGADVVAFLERHGIEAAVPSEITGPTGPTSTIEVAIQADRQPWMDHFVPGVWDGYRLSPAEQAVLGRARRLHAVLVEGAIAELDRLARAEALAGIEVSADFLGFRHYSVPRLAETMAHVDLGFVGWPGAEDDPTVAGMRAVAHDLGRRLVVTMGSRAVHVFDGQARRDWRFPVQPVEVRGTTLGCGDAFIAGFLDAWWRAPDVPVAVEQGMMNGAAATAWPRPLPDDAYAHRRSFT